MLLVEDNFGELFGVCPTFAANDSGFEKNRMMVSADYHLLDICSAYSRFYIATSASHYRDYLDLLDYLRTGYALPWLP